MTAMRWGITARHVARAAIAAGSPALVALAALACGRDDPRTEVGWSPGGTGSVVRTSGLSAGPPVPDPTARNPYADDERSIAEGKALYEGFNCAGCHGGAGGGGIGPPFADRLWIYGDEPENIFQSIAQGRPNGMPSFGGKIPEEVMWRIVAYVRSLTPTAGGGGGAK
jgi:cytochrome c oxidase cbb3-type subunit III